MISSVLLFILFLYVTAGFRSSLSSFSRVARFEMSWSDSNWNWGSAVGKAHDVAMKTRSSLRTRDVRKAWIEKIASEGDTLDIEELKMVIALRMQLGSRQGKDGCGTGWNLMCDMADCRYEGASGLELLKGDLQTLADKLPESLTNSVEAQESDTLGYVAAAALAGTDFVADGL